MITFKLFMKKRGLTNKVAAQALEISPQMVSQWKNDSRIFVDEQTWKIIRISEIRDNVDEIFGIK